MSPTEAQVNEVNQKFARLIRNFGYDNTRGTERHSFEVEFAYALNEVKHAPPNHAQKYIDKANLVVANVIKRVKELQGQVDA